MRFINILCLSLAISTPALAADGIPLLRWAGPPGSRPETRAEWLAENPEGPFLCLPASGGDGRAPGDSGAVAVIVQQSIASALTPSLAQLSANLGGEGYDVLQRDVSGGTPQDLRFLLQHLRDSAAIEGALLIGNLPVPWFQVEDDFQTYGYAEWPCDLYYMDLDGQWLDTISHASGGWAAGSDGIFDVHQGEMTPEIFVGRLTTTGMGTDTVLLKNYFLKDNAYRRDSIALERRALVFVDDDWEPWGPWWADDVAQLYPDTADFFDPNETRASLYRGQLDTARAWVSLFAHSSPGLHQFAYDSGSSHDYYYSTEYTSQDPPANFYNFFCCSFGRYTTGGYGAGRSVFTQSHGLGAIASTKTGSMLEFTPFYQSLAQGKSLGQAFGDWFEHITQDGVTFDELCWHYGMTLLGDPFLRPAGHLMGVTGRHQAEAAGQQLSMMPIRPNPARDGAAMVLKAEFSGRLSLSVYDLAGRKLRTIFSGQVRSGVHRWEWDLRDDAGRRVPGGVYFCRASAAGGSSTARVTVLR